MFCLSKGLGAPVGSMLVGSREFIEKARIYRKLLGGGMRQVGVLAARRADRAGRNRPRVCTKTTPTRAIWPKAWRECPALAVDLQKVQTNIVILRRARHRPHRRGHLRRARASAKSSPIPPDNHAMRMVTHCDVDRAGIDRALAVWRDFGVAVTPTTLLSAACSAIATHVEDRSFRPCLFRGVCEDLTLP